MESFVFESHEKNANDFTSQFNFAASEIVVQLLDARTDAVAEIENVGQRRPIFVFCGYF